MGKENETLLEQTSPNNAPEVSPFSLGQLLGSSLADKWNKARRYCLSPERETVIKNIRLVRKYLKTEDEELNRLLAEPVDQVNDELLTPNLGKVINRLNYLAKHEQTKEKVRFINRQDTVFITDSKRAKIVAIFPGDQKWLARWVEATNHQRIRIISGTNSMDRNPTYNEEGERMVYLPIFYLIKPILGEKQPS